MKKLKSGDILFSRTTQNESIVFFYQVIRSTTSTCEVREIRKDIKTQLHDEQEVVPVKNAFTSGPLRRRVLPSGCIKIEEELYAWAWDGKSQWQSILIYI